MKKIIPIIILSFLILNGFGTSAIKIKEYNNQTNLNDEYDLIIITPSIFFEDLEPLMEHKNLHEVMTKIVTLEEIYTGTYYPTEGRDDAEQIKYFIKNSIENWNIKYVMLVGGKEEMPVRYSNILSIGNQNYKWDFLSSGLIQDKSVRFISDLYFADIYDENNSFCSWDSNNNSIFGETGYDDEIDELDLYPDVGIGRILCKTTLEIQNIVDKIIDYENNAFGNEWFDNLIVCTAKIRHLRLKE